MATLLLLVQPIATNMLFPVKYKMLQESMLFIYLIVTIPFAIYKFMTVNIHSTVSKWHHLQWNMLVDSNNKSEANIFMAFWLFFFLFPLFYQEKKYGLIFGVDLYIEFFQTKRTLVNDFKYQQTHRLQSSARSDSKCQQTHSLYKSVSSDSKCHQTHSLLQRSVINDSKCQRTHSQLQRILLVDRSLNLYLTHC
jgi:hypothetical protein